MIDEDKVKKVLMELMFTISGRANSSRENWNELYAAACAAKEIIEHSPSVYYHEITPEEGLAAERLGKKIGIEISNILDLELGTPRN